MVYGWYIQMTSPAPDGSAHIWDILASSLCSGRTWRHLVHHTRSMGCTFLLFTAVCLSCSLYGASTAKKRKQVTHSWQRSPVRPTELDVALVHCTLQCQSSPPGELWSQRIFGDDSWHSHFTCLLGINISAVKLGVYTIHLLPNSRPAVNTAQLDNVSL